MFGFDKKPHIYIYNIQPNETYKHKSTMSLLSLRPRRACIAAWIATGYFTSEHFVEDGMERDEAIELLDPSGMLVKMGIPSDQLVQCLDTNRRGDIFKIYYISETF